MARIHGLIAVVMLFAAFLAGGYVVFRDSMVFGVIYAAVIAVFFIVIPAVYCEKCPCRDKCMHAILGPISKFIRPHPDKSYYTAMDVVLTLAIAAAAVVFPQLWLLKDIPLLIFYWAAVGLAAGEVLLFVCRGCENEKCPMKNILGKPLQNRNKPM